MISTLADYLLEHFTEVKDKRSQMTTWIASDKFNGIDIELSVVKIDGSRVKTFDHEQISKILSTGVKWLNREYEQTIDKIMDEVFKFGRTRWDIPCRTVDEMKRFAYMDCVDASIYCVTNGSRYILDHILFTLWYNNEPAHQNDTFFDGHSLTINMNFDKSGNVLNSTKKNWRLEG